MDLPVSTMREVKVLMKRIDALILILNKMTGQTYKVVPQKQSTRKDDKND